MRVAITGSHGVGKTTLVSSLHTHFWTSPFSRPQPLFRVQLEEAVRSVARDMELETLSDIFTWPKYKIEYFQWLSAMRQVVEETRVPSFISDRSIVDYIAYTIYYGCSYTMVEALMDFAEQHIETYDILFYAPVPVEFDYSLTREDGFRLTDDKSVRQIDELINNLLQQNYPHVALPEERNLWFDFCCKEIEKEREY